MSERLPLRSSGLANFDPTRGLMFDTNVWLLIYGHSAGPPDSRTTAYSAFYKQALVNKCPIYVCQTVVTEYVAVSLRIRAKMAGWAPAPTAGKIHAQPDYPRWTTEVSDEVSYILADTKCLSDDFDGSNIENDLLRARLEIHVWAVRRSRFPPMATSIMAFEMSMRAS